jgi:hypothetical protein
MADGHRVASPADVECSAHSRTAAPKHLRPVGEVDYADEKAQLFRGNAIRF